MRIFFINLDRRPERRAFMERQLNALGVKCERVTGIDGRELSKADRRRHLRAFRWWCANGYRARNGEIGCALSHQTIYDCMISREIDCACILEDDIRLTGQFAEMLVASERLLSSSTPANVIILSPYKGKRKPESAMPSLLPVKWAVSAGGYVLDKEAARRLLAVNVPLHTTIDNWGRLARLAKIKLFAANPTVCLQDDYAWKPDDPAFATDTIDIGTVFVDRMPWHRRIAHKAMRVVGRTIDALIR